MIEISFPLPARPWSVNERIHWARRADLTRIWRGTTTMHTRAWHARNRSVWNRHKDRPALVCVEIPFPDRRRRDPHNYAGTVVKAIVDGLVDAGLWPDDTPDWVTVADPTFTVDRSYGGGSVRVRIWPNGETPLGRPCGVCATGEATA